MIRFLLGFIKGFLTMMAWMYLLDLLRPRPRPITHCLRCHERSPYVLCMRCFYDSLPAERPV